jgi:hypothetical protein
MYPSVTVWKAAVPERGDATVDLQRVRKARGSGALPSRRNDNLFFLTGSESFQRLGLGTFFPPLETYCIASDTRLGSNVYNAAEPLFHLDLWPGPW